MSEITFRIITVRINFSNGNYFSKTISYLPGTSGLIDKTSSNFFKGDIRQFGALFIAEFGDILNPKQNFTLISPDIDEIFSNRGAYYAAMLESCDYLSIENTIFEQILSYFIGTLRESKKIATPELLFTETMVEKIIATRSIENLCFICKHVNYLGPRIGIKLNWICNGELDDQLLAELVLYFDIIELCANNNRDVTTVAPFAKTLKVLHAAGRYCGITDTGLAEAHSIEHLDSSNNPQITNVAPFAGTLRRLKAAAWDCGISDKGLADAHWIEELDASDNFRITTVDPFAKALRVLDASGDACCINDVGLADAHWIEELNANCNSRITTVTPFAATLLKLKAMGVCGINDVGLAEAHSIEKLDVDDNLKITTVAPFAAALKILNASYRSSINDAGLREAHWIEELDASENPSITTVKPFAKTLKKLNANRNSGIDDIGLRNAHSIEELRASNNPKITTVKPFAKALRLLDASGSVCGISVAGLTDAHSIEELNVHENAKLIEFTAYNSTSQKINKVSANAAPTNAAPGDTRASWTVRIVGKTVNPVMNTNHTGNLLNFF